MPNISEKLQKHIRDFNLEINYLFQKIKVFSDFEFEQGFLEREDRIKFKEAQLFVLNKMIRMSMLIENVSKYKFIDRKDLEEIQKIKEEFLLEAQKLTNYKVKNPDLFIFLLDLKRAINNQVLKVFERLPEKIQKINEAYRELKVQSYFNSLMKVKYAAAEIKKAIDLLEAQSSQDPRFASLDFAPLKDLETELSEQYEQRLIAFFKSSKVRDFAQKYYEKITDEDFDILTRPLTEKYKQEYEGLSERTMLEFINGKIFKIEGLKKEYEDFITKAKENPGSLGGTLQSDSEINSDYYLAFYNLSSAINGLSDNEEAQKQLLFLMEAMKKLAQENQQLRKENSELAKERKASTQETQQVLVKENSELRHELEAAASMIAQMNVMMEGIEPLNITVSPSRQVSQADSLNTSLLSPIRARTPSSSPVKVVSDHSRVQSTPSRLSESFDEEGLTWV